MSDITPIYAPKRSCPRDRGFWYCDKCWDRFFDEGSEVDFPIPMRGCGRVTDGLICGKTHQGYEWCKECKAAGRTEPNPHIGEFEIVGMVKEKDAFPEPESPGHDLLPA